MSYHDHAVRPDPNPHTPPPPPSALNADDIHGFPHLHLQISPRKPPPPALAMGGLDPF